MKTMIICKMYRVESRVKILVHKWNLRFETKKDARMFLRETQEKTTFFSSPDACTTYKRKEKNNFIIERYIVRAL